ncbi:MAG: tRNA (N6-isopentenyl adenosine(37)-C2)-methylthiotransferase MiaB [Treponema sp.]|nr:tRNA (N6-isopentenyl adenosine(37)-C2)-methylthiotransferase MiaB [Treponema sp.]
MKYFFETYGCQMNVAESVAMVRTLEERSWQRAETIESADLVIVNTCSVRRTAEQRVFGRLDLFNALKRKAVAERGMRGRRPFKVLVAGCMASRLGEKLKADFVMGTRDKTNFPRILKEVETFNQGELGTKPTPYPFAVGEETAAFSPLHYEEGAIRSFVPIMHGCDNFCAYCIVPYTRGREVSRSPSDILAEIRAVSAKNAREITLLGQNINAYRWNDVSFAELLEIIAQEIERMGDKIRWARFLSSHPKNFSTKIIEVMARYRCFCRHLHLCVQHGSDRVLEAMNRRYTRAWYLELVGQIRAALPDVTFSTDILIGFPGETEADFEEALELMRQVRFLYAYTYHFNPREGTAAFSLPYRVPDEVQRKRLSAVIALQKEISAELLNARIGERVVVLIEGFSKRNADELICRTERDEMVVIPGDGSRIGEFAEVRLETLNGNTFRGKELKE